MREVQSSIAAGLEHRPRVQTGTRRILVVDDETYIASLVSEMIFRELHEQPVQVHTAEDAIEELKKGEFYLIVSDIRMPGIGGFGLFNWILEKRPDLKHHFFFITGHAGGPDADRMLDEFRVPVIQKPFSYADLIQCCRNLLRATVADEVQCQSVAA